MARRGRYIGLYSVLFDDPDYLAMSSAARHMLLTMRLSSAAGLLCFWRLDWDLLADQTGYPRARLGQLMKELERHDWVRVDRPWVWIRNGLKHDPTILLGNLNHAKAVRGAISGLPKCQLAREFCTYYGFTYPHDPIPDGIPHAIPHALPHAIPDGIPMVSPINSPSPNPSPNPNPNPNTNPEPFAHANGIESTDRNSANLHRARQLIKQVFPDLKPKES